MVLSTDGPEGTRLQLQAGRAGDRDDGDRADADRRAGRHRARDSGELLEQRRVQGSGTIRRPITSRRWPRCSPATSAAPSDRHYVSPDGSARPARLPHASSRGPGWRWSPAMQTYGFITAKPGSRVFVTNGSEIKTYSGLLGAGGAITDLKPFANRGGESVAVRDRTGASTSPTARCSSTRPTARRSAASTCPSGRCSSCSAARTGARCSS